MATITLAGQGNCRQPSGPQPLDDLSDGLNQLDQWRAQPTLAGTLFKPGNEVCRAFYKHLLASAADLIGEASPTWLAAHRPQTAALTERLCLFAHGLADGSQLMADWILHTHGLRAQRSALMQGDANQLVALRALDVDLRRLEETMLASWLVVPDLAGDDRRQALAGQATADMSALLGGAAAAAAQLAETRAVEWRALRQRCTTLRQRLVQEGLLPADLRLDSAKLAQAVSPTAALLMLAPLPGQAQLLISLRKPTDGLASASHQIAPAPRAFDKFSCGTLHALARKALTAAARGAPRRTVVNLPDEPVPAPPGLAPAVALDSFALDGFGAVARAAVLPAIRSLAAQGAAFALVPTGDLHLLPWSFVLADDLPLGCSLAAYPDCAAFARHGTHGRGARGQSGALGGRRAPQRRP